MNKPVKVITVIVLIVTAAVFIPHIINLTPDELAELMPDSVPGAALFLFVLYCIKSVVFVIPMLLLYVCAGLIMPPAAAVVFTLFCVSVEMTIGFFAGRKLGLSRVRKIASESKYAGKLFDRIGENVFLSSFVLRFIPVFSMDIVSMIFGAAGVDYPEFMAGSLLGLIPGLIPAVLAGNSIAKPFSAEFLVPFSVFAFLSIMCTLIYFIRNKRNMTE